jgi:hypothetical protein
MRQGRHLDVEYALLQLPYLLTTSLRLARASVEVARERAIGFD